MEYIDSADASYTYTVILNGYNAQIDISSAGDDVLLSIPSEKDPVLTSEAVNIISKFPGYSCLKISANIGQGIKTTYIYITLDIEKQKKKPAGSYSVTSCLAGGEAGLVYVGEGLKDLCEASGEGYILKINSLYYTVAGFYDSAMGSMTEDSVTLAYSTCSDEALTSIDMLLNDAATSPYSLYIEFSSDDDTVIAQWQDIADELMKANISATYSSQTEAERTAVSVYRDTLSLFYAAIFVFAFGNLLISASYWIKCRENELVIRRTYGSSVPALIKVLLRDIAFMCGLAAVVVMVLELVSCVVGGFESLKMSYFLWDVLVYILGLIAIFIILTAAVIKKYVGISPSESL